MLGMEVATLKYSVSLRVPTEVPHLINDSKRNKLPAKTVNKKRNLTYAKTRQDKNKAKRTRSCIPVDHLPIGVGTGGGTRGMCPPNVS